MKKNKRTNIKIVIYREAGVFVCIEVYIEGWGWGSGLRLLFSMGDAWDSIFSTAKTNRNSFSNTVG